MRYQDLSGFDTARATDTKNIFEGCEHLTLLDLYGSDTSGVTCMMRMFADCRDMQRIVMNPTIHKEADTYQMFFNCNAAIIWDIKRRA